MNVKRDCFDDEIEVEDKNVANTVDHFYHIDNVNLVWDLFYVI